MTKRIMICPDVPDWAIGSLSSAIVKHNPRFEFLYHCLHPRDVVDKISEFKKAVEEFKPDVIHFQYYRSCSQALELWEGLKDYKIILTHHNQKDKAVFHKKWQEIGVDHLVCHTQNCKKFLLQNGEKDITVIQHGIDLDYFKYTDDEPKSPRIGYAGRIVPWKGLREILKVAHETDNKVLVMGRQDKPDYFESLRPYIESADWSFFDCEDQDRVEAYNSMTCYVGNSRDGLEEGTLPYLEAMACGVPVITTLSGEARDLAVDGVNALVVPFEEEEGSYEKLKSAIIRVLDDKELRAKLRKGGWNTVKNMCEEKMAREYGDLYFKVGSDKPLVSVVIPATYKNDIKQVLDGLQRQTYDNIEAIIVWDEEDKTGDSDYRNYKFPILELYTGKKGYNLAMARNMGVIEAHGEYILLNDARLCPEPNAIEKFLEATIIPSENKVWYFGNKGSNKKSFVENFSFVRRDDLIEFGMFNERIDMYGGMSQEIRTRWSSQGGLFLFKQDAECKPIKGSRMSKTQRPSIVKMKLKLFCMYSDTKM